MDEILHQLIGSLSHYLQDFIHPRCDFQIWDPWIDFFPWQIFLVSGFFLAKLERFQTELKKTVSFCGKSLPIKILTQLIRHKSRQQFAVAAPFFCAGKNFGRQVSNWKLLLGIRCWKLHCWASAAQSPGHWNGAAFRRLLLAGDSRWTFTFWTIKTRGTKI